jgi:RNA polymerase sigma-70 factor, ECF subfamily
MIATGAGHSPGTGPAAGTQLDFAAEFQGCHRLLWTIAAGIVGRSAAADDVVQEAALLALEKLDQFQPGSNFRAWMAQMVRFVALNYARRIRRNRAASLDGDPGKGDVAVPAPAAGLSLRLLGRGELPPDQAHFDDQVVAALNSVQPIARACLLLRTLEQLEYTEIATLLDIPAGTAMSHVHRTRQYLRQRLAGMDPIRKEVRS